MGGGGGWGKSQKKNSCKGKCQEKKFVQRRRERKKIHAGGRSNCDFYLKYITSANKHWLKCMELTDLRDSHCVSVVLIKTFSVLLLQACL